MAADLTDWSLKNGQELERAREKEAAIAQRQRDEAELARVGEEFGFTLETLIGVVERAYLGFLTGSLHLAFEQDFGEGPGYKPRGPSRRQDCTKGFAHGNQIGA
jgi:hypothetical protein